MFDVSGKVVFLSGPMTGIEHYNVGAFAEAHDVLLQAGAASVYDPAIEYLTAWKNARKRWSHEDYMLKTVNELTTDDANLSSDVPKRLYDVVVQLDGWEASDGAILESQVAHAIGIPCVSIREVAHA